MKRKPYRRILAQTGARGIVDSATCMADIQRLRRRIPLSSRIIYRTAAGGIVLTSLATLIVMLTRGI